MGKIRSNEKVDQDFYLMTVEQENKARMGQFYISGMGYLSGTVQTDQCV